MKRTIFIGAVIPLVFFCYLVPKSLAASGNDNTAIQLERIVITPSRHEEYDYREAGNITVIDRKDIESSTATNVADLLKLEAGVVVSAYTGNRKTVKVDLRGFGETASSNVLVLVDGRRINQIDMSGADWVQIPVEAVEKIEVLRGAGSVLYGDNATGGVINIITKKGAAHPYGKIRAAYGSYDAFSSTGEAGGSLRDILYYFNGKYYDTKGYRENNALRAKDFNGRLDYDISDRLTLAMAAGYHKDDYGMPGALSEANMGSLGRRQSVYMQDRARTKDRYIRLLTEARPVFDGTDIGKFTTSIAVRRRRSYTSSIAWGVNSTTQNNIRTTDFYNKYENELTFGDSTVGFTTGIDYSKAENSLSGRGWSVDEIDISKEMLGAYFDCEDRIGENLILSGGYRYEKNTYIFDQSQSKIKYTKRKPSASVVQGSLVYLYKEDSSIFCDYRESFRFPATDEWYINSGPNMGLNESLEPQEGEQYEVGIKHRISKRSRLDATLYLMNIKNEIFYNPATFFNENYPRTRHAGIELGLDLEINEGASVFSNYTYERAKFREGDYSGNDIPAVPNHKFSSGVRLNPLAGLDLILTGNYVGSRYMISDQKNQVDKMDDYITFDTKMTYTKGRLEVSFGINNIFNENYSEYGVTNSAGTAKNFYPSPERNFEFSVAWKF